MGNGKWGVRKSELGKILTANERGLTRMGVGSGGNSNREPSPLSKFRRVKMDADFREWDLGVGIWEWGFGSGDLGVGIWEWDAEY